jgi:queuine tRNA-ribosyltransferase
MFTLDSRSPLRRGRLITKHGVISTPAYVPVATNAAIKGCFPFFLDDIGIQLAFVNTYHMLIHPGVSVVQNAEGLHSFMNRQGPIITDSGGFQIFSLQYGGVAEEIKSSGKKRQHGHKHIIKIDEEGVLFRSYRTGEKILLTPESTIEAQYDMGSDILIPLDELLPFHINSEYFESSFEKTHRWQIRSFEHYKKLEKKGGKRLIYAVIHGGTSLQHREKSAKILSAYDFDGFAIGGSLGKSASDIIAVVRNTLSWLPEEAPKHLLGVADFETVKEVVPLGIDTFDSAYPTKCARHGWLFTEDKPIKITQLVWRENYEPCSVCPMLTQYSYAYLHHLFKSHESLGGIIASIHNMWFLENWCRKIKKLY